MVQQGRYKDTLQQGFILAANAVRQRLEVCVNVEAEEQRLQLEAAYGKAEVVLSTVRCNVKRNLGVLADARRMTVAITRARRGLVVIGSESTLKTSPHWNPWLTWRRKHQGRATAAVSSALEKN
jgi:hypothetical protein